MVVIGVEYSPATDVNCASAKPTAGRSSPTLGLGGIIQVLGTHPWIVGSWVAERFCIGRIFLAGDSAHVTPPAGGFGASLGVHDAHNLCTKLGQVLSGEASEKLLDRYEPERLPVANFIVNQATSSFKGLSSLGCSETAQSFYDETSITLGYRATAPTPSLSEDLESESHRSWCAEWPTRHARAHVAMSNREKWMSSLTSIAFILF
jgi:2-polyprenyl-6-methoxyphenol hydroxylase-like FAD-dependent oxidoreductase